MAFKFTFTPEELQAAHEALIEKGVLDKADRERRILGAQHDGYITMFEFGSLLHKNMSDLPSTVVKGVAKNMKASFSQAFTYYGGEAGRRTLMLALSKAEGEKAYGAVRQYKISSAKEFITFYKDLDVRENPVNNPIYNLGQTIKVETENGETIECLTCLSNTEGPLHVGDELTIEEQGYILGYSHGGLVDHRLDNLKFREAGAEGTASGVELAELQAHQLTGAAYYFFWREACDRWGFPENEYSKKLGEVINRVRRDMLPSDREFLESEENKGDRPDGLAPRFEKVSDDLPRETPEQVFKKYVAANDKINNILMKRPAYREWDREWRVPDVENPFLKFENS